MQIETVSIIRNIKNGVIFKIYKSCKAKSEFFFTFLIIHVSCSVHQTIVDEIAFTLQGRS